MPTAKGPDYVPKGPLGFQYICKNACLKMDRQYKTLYFIYFKTLYFCHLSFTELGTDRSGKIEVEPGICHTSRLHRAYPAQAPLT